MVEIEISNSALDYLKSLAKPLEDTTVTVFDRIVEEHQSKNNSQTVMETAASLSFGISDIPNVTFTSISSASINKRPLVKKDWNTVLGRLIELCAEKTSNIDTLVSLLDANIQTSKPDEIDKKKGFRYLPKANISFQGLDAKRACRNIMILSQNFSIPISLKVKWSNNPDADFPGKTATINLP